jgi:hypothetical protein
MSDLGWLGSRTSAVVVGAVSLWLAAIVATHAYLLLRPVRIAELPEAPASRVGTGRWEGFDLFALGVLCGIATVSGVLLLAAVTLTWVIALVLLGLGGLGLWLVYGPQQSPKRYGIGLLILIGFLAVGGLFLFAVHFSLSPYLILLARARGEG